MKDSKAGCWLGQAFGVREVVTLRGEAYAVAHPIDAERLKRVSDRQSEVCFVNAGDVLKII